MNDTAQIRPAKPALHVVLLAALQVGIAWTLIPFGAVCYFLFWRFHNAHTSLLARADLNTGRLDSWRLHRDTKPSTLDL